MKKRIISLILILVMAIGFMPTVTFAANTTEFLGGSGTEADPYLISNKTHLNNVRNYLNAHFKLICDIEFDDSDFASGGAFYNSGKGFTPIGTKDSSFAGSFDGNGYAIKNLYINISSSSTVYTGLFGYNGGIIKNLGVVDGSVSSKCSSSSSHAYVGAIAGYNYGGTIENCYNTGAVSAVSTSYYAYAGGTAGYNNYGTITNCYNTGEVSATSTSYYAYAGGTMGYNHRGTIENCYNTGTVFSSSSYAGGITGYTYSGTIENCYNTGTVSASSSSISRSAYPGGIAGYNYRGTIENCYNTGAVSASAYAGGIAGYDDSGTITSCYYADIISKGVGRGTDTATKCIADQLKEQSTFIGFDFEDVWTFDKTLKYHLAPILKNLKYIEKEMAENTTEFAGGHGTVFSPYIISNKTHLNNVRNYLDAHFKMIADIEFTDADFASGGSFYNSGKGWAPIATDMDTAFTGSFNGNGHTIKNLHINISSSSRVYAGLFGYNKGIIKNLGLVDGDITAASTSSNSFVGGIAGYNSYGKIESCYNTGSVSGGCVGGIVGENHYSKLTNCYNTGSVSGGCAGGIAGENCFSEITNCYNTGVVDGSSYVGGILGLPYTGSTVTNCYYAETTLDGIGSSKYIGTSCTKEQLCQQSTFSGFDFENVWTFDETLKYHKTPVLKNVKHIEGELVDNTTEFAGGNGTIFSPYLISNKTHLNNVRNYPGASYKLLSNIEFTAADFAKNGTFYNDGCGFEPIEYFSGRFDGNGYSIKNLYMNVTSDSDTSDSNVRIYIGLFGTNYGTIKNLGITDCNILVKSISSYISVGGITGYNIGLITNCYNTGSISMSEPDSASVSDLYAGGIAGNNEKVITNCYNTGNISLSVLKTGSYAYAGGIAGDNSYTIEKSYNTGKISVKGSIKESISYTSSSAGGIVGDNDETITNCYNIGYISATSARPDDSAVYACGIAGSGNGGKVTNCYNLGSLSGNSYLYAIAGSGNKNTNCYYIEYQKEYDDTSIKCSLEQMQVQSTFVGFDFENVWTFDDTLKYHKTPVLKDLNHIESEFVQNTSEFAGGTGTPFEPYLISNKTHLNNVRKYPFACFKLMCNIEFTDSDFEKNGAFYNDGCGFEPIGDENTSFSGCFDGNGYSIKNLYINVSSVSDAYVGLFGYSKGLIKNLGIVNGNISASSSKYNTNIHTGGIAGKNDGTIENCYNTGVISASTYSLSYIGGIVGYNERGTIENCYNTGTVSSSSSYSDSTSYVGGIVGRNYYYSTIENCYNTGSVSGDSFIGGIVGDNDGTITVCYNTGNVLASDDYIYAGGIAGSNYGPITVCYNTGNVSWLKSGNIAYIGGIAGEGGDITDCYNTGSVTGGNNTGGIVGLNKGEYKITNCYNVGNVTGGNNTGGIVGYYNPTHSLINNIINCYYIDSISKGVGKGTDNAIKCTAEQLKQISTYADFDFENVWTMQGDPEYFYAELIAINEIQSKTIKEILVSKMPYKILFVKNKDTLDLSGAVLEIKFMNNTYTYLPLTEVTVTGFDNSVIGKQILTAEYKNFTSAFEIEIIAPAVDVKQIEVTSTTVTLKQVEGFEYSLDKINWQNSNIFENLTPLKEYSFYQRKAKTEEYSAGEISQAFKITTAAPAATLQEKTPTSVTLVPLSGYEYSMDGINWQNNNVFENLEVNTEYSFYQRVAKTDKTDASLTSDVLTVRTLKKTVNAPQKPVAIRITTTTVELQKYQNYEYSKDGVNWTTNNVFTGLNVNKMYKFYQRVAETDKIYASERSEVLIVKTLPKSNCSITPAKPIVADYTVSMVVLVARDGYEYSKDGVNWTTDPSFKNLEPNTKYTFYQRIAETDSELASAKSVGISVTTDQLNYTSSSTFNRILLMDYIEKNGVKESDGRYTITETDYDQTTSLVVKDDNLYVTFTKKIGNNEISQGGSFEFQITDISQLLVIFYSYYYRASKFGINDFVEETVVVDRSLHTKDSTYTLQNEGDILSNETFTEHFNNALDITLTYWDSFIYEKLGFGLRGLGFTSYDGYGKTKCDWLTGYHTGTDIIRGKRDAKCTVDGNTGHIYCSDCRQIKSAGKTIECAGKHSYTNCDKVCPVCKEERIVEHVYTDDCDTTCNICNAKRIANHLYDNECDADCNICGAQNETAHYYDNNCDNTCNICGNTRLTNHTYDNNCDSVCNVCSKTRTVPDHVYDGVCDATCNECGKSRTVPDHVYTNSCDTSCNECGAIRTINHTYDNSCDTSCNVCGAVRTIQHKYDNACDKDCNVCGAVRSVSAHVYSNYCDSSCNVCGAIRVVPAHVYTNNCDTNCNVCGAVRTITHTFGDYVYNNNATTEKDGTKTRTCSVCGHKETVTATGTKLPKPQALTNPFVDVKQKDFFYNATLWAVSKGITTGTSKTTFSPKDPCTRGQVVTFLWRAAGSPEPKSSRMPFTDVGSKAFYRKAVLWAVEQGITSGTSATTFSPNETCTRGQIATFLWRAKGKPAPKSTYMPFRDVPTKNFAYKAILWAVENKITTGTSKTTFGPSEACTRGQIVTFLYRAYK